MTHNMQIAANAIPGVVFPTLTAIHFHHDPAEEPREPPEFGCCLPPGECCMPGLHFPSECHTSDDYDIHHELCISHALERGTLG